MFRGGLGMKPNGGTADPIRQWLVRVNLFLLACLLLLSMNLVWRLTTLIFRIDRTAASMSRDVAQVAGTAGTIARDVEGLREEARELKGRLAESVPVEEFTDAFDAVLTAGRAITADSSELPPSADAEIKALLRALLYSGMRYDDDGEERSVGSLWGRLYAKYRVMRKGLVSAEDFIEKVASRSVLGHEYYLIDETGERVLLEDWMLEALSGHRQERDGGDAESRPSP